MASLLTVWGPTMQHHFLYLHLCMNQGNIQIDVQHGYLQITNMKKQKNNKNENLLKGKNMTSLLILLTI